MRAAAAAQNIKRLVRFLSPADSTTGSHHLEKKRKTQ